MTTPTDDRDPLAVYRASLTVPYADRPATGVSRPNAHLDARDLDILVDRSVTLNRRSGARAGDFIRLLDGSERRIAYCWDDGVQTTDHGSFYLGDGGISYSGGLDAAITLDRVRPIRHISRLGRVWFFHHDQWRAHSSVHGWLDFRVYEEVGG